MSRSQPAHVIFDFGAVLFRWEPLVLFREVLPQRAWDEVLTRALADRVFKGFTGVWGRFDAGTIERDELVPALVVQSGLRHDEIEALIDAIPAHLQPLPDTVALMDDLQAAGHRLFFLSNMPAPYAAHLSRTHDFLRGFEDGLFSCDVRMIKPDPAIFRLALERFDVSARQTLFIDDHLGNIEAANRLGLPALLFTDAAGLERDLVSRGVRLG